MACTVLAVVSASPLFIERTYLFNILFMPVVLFIVLEERQAPGRAKYLLPLIFALWVNTHPTFILGLVILGWRIVCNFRQHQSRHYRLFALMSGLSVTACCIHPEGWRGAWYPIQFAFNEAVDLKTQTLESLPPWSPRLSQFFEIKVFYFLLALSPSLVLLARKKKPFFEAGLMIFTTYLGLSAVRFLAPASACLTLLYSKLASDIHLFSFEETAKKSRVINPIALTVITTALGLGILALITGTYPSVGAPRRSGLGLDTRFFPDKSISFIDHLNTDTNVFNGHGLGCFLAWKWGGERKIFYHGFLNDENFYQKQYVGMIRGRQEFDRIIREYNIGVIFLGKMNGYTILNHNLHDSGDYPDWPLAFEDEASYVYVRKDILHRRGP